MTNPKQDDDELHEAKFRYLRAEAALAEAKKRVAEAEVDCLIAKKRVEALEVQRARGE